MIFNIRTVAVYIKDWLLDLYSLRFLIVSWVKEIWPGSSDAALWLNASEVNFPSNTPSLIFPSLVLRSHWTQEEHTNLKAEEATLAWREWFMSVD